MLRIGLISDTHHFLDDQVFRHFESCDEIWHAGDFGTIELANKLAAFKPLKGVYGNIDGQDIRSLYPEKLSWLSEGIKVFMTHIGGYPPKYNPTVKRLLQADPPQLFIRVQPNPSSAGICTSINIRSYFLRDTNSNA